MKDGKGRHYETCGASRRQHPAVFTISVFLACLFVLFSSPARAACSDCECVRVAHSIVTVGVDPETATLYAYNVTDEHDETRDLIKQNFEDQEEWFLERWTNSMTPTLMRMAEHFVSLGMDQAMIIGTFFDGLQELKTQQLYNRLTAEGQKDYQPSIGVCIMGTNIRSLASSERRGDYTRYVMSQRSQDRQLGHRNALGADGLHYDLRARIAQFKARYCDVRQNAGLLAEFCGASAPPATRGRDIDYAALVDRPATLNIDFTDAAAPTDDEIDIFALADNLYANNLATRISEANFDSAYNRQKVLDLRSIVAKRSVAENAFYSIVGMKSLGSLAVAGGPATADIKSVDTAKFMKILLRQLGVADPDMDNLIGASPSYFAQMNVLTKMVYQRPAFYTDLYDTGPNIARKSTAMTAIQLMQNFDLWESYLRQEAMLSVWLELDLKKYQDDVVNRVNRLQTSDRTEQ